jgi:dATP pyrophosphohydrolase
VARAPFQVIVFPFIAPPDGEPRYAIFRRRSIPTMWQAISGGGEDAETPRQAAEREACEECGIQDAARWIALDARASIPASVFPATEHWPRDRFVVPEHAFGVGVADVTIRLSDEHHEHAWLPFLDAHRQLTWDSNKVALWELHCRVCGVSPRDLPDPALSGDD